MKLLLTILSLAIFCVATETYAASDSDKDTKVAIWNPSIDWSTHRALQTSSVTASFTATDTRLWAKNPNTSYASVTSISVDRDDGGFVSQALVKFDVSSIPSGATVTSATIRFYTNNRSRGQVKASKMKVNWSGTSTWSTFGGNGVQADGTEAESTQSFAFTPSTNGVYVSANVSTDVQSFVTNASTNYGWLLTINSTDGWDFDATENSSKRGPLLTVTYTLTSGPAPAPVSPPAPVPVTAPVPVPVPTPVSAPVSPPTGSVYRPGDLTVIKYE